MAVNVTSWTQAQLDEAAKTLRVMEQWVKEHTGPLNHRECGICVDWEYDAPIDQWCEECRAKQAWLPAIALIQAALRTLEGLREWLIRHTCEASDIMVAASLSIDAESFDVAHVTYDTLNEVLTELLRVWPAPPGAAPEGDR